MKGLTILPTLLNFALLSRLALADPHIPLPRRAHVGRRATPSANQSTSTGSATSAPVPTETIPLDSSTLEDLETVRSHRIDQMVAGVIQPGNPPLSDIASWMSTLDSEGKWPDSEINYATGCDAQRANWPASVHWQRITVMSAAYHSGPALSNVSQWAQSDDLEASISSAMDWWFSRDMATDSCLDGGNTTACPCGTQGNWNTNWFSNVILIPNLAVQSCLLMNETLSPTQSSNCSHFATRAISPFYRANPPGFVSGANILDMARIGIDYALRVNNATLVVEGFSRIHAQMVVEPGIKKDGIKSDGSFGQHLGLLYNGNYGKDFANAVLNLEETAIGTQFASNKSQQSVFSTLIDADSWMVVYNTVTKVLHWDLSVLSRFIVFPTADAIQPTSSLRLNLTQIALVGQQWGSDALTGFAKRLSSNSTSANAGKVKGNRFFFANDYMVHRGSNYVSTLKLFSKRTLNTECTNDANPLGFHLADGALYTYKNGDEYEDISAAWDWDLIPGITTDYGETPLSCAKAKFTGNESFVGGTSTGKVGIAAMRYTNPYTKSLQWQKAWFFLDDDVQRVMISNISSTTDAPIYSVLDQKKHSGDIFIDGSPVAETSSMTCDAGSLWHDNVGYTFEDSTITVRVGESSGNWSAIGTSSQPPVTVDLFAAYIEHDNITDSVEYTAYPAVDFVTFQSKSASSKVCTVRNDKHISAVWDDGHHLGMVVFWDAAGGSVTIDKAHAMSATGSLTITSSANAAVIYDANSGNVTVADPSQNLTALQVDFALNQNGAWRNQTIQFTLPSGPGGLAGSSLTKALK